MSIDTEDALQDIARSSYADMLHDHERNMAYNSAIEICVNALVKSKKHNPNGDRFYYCCDIGTGSGLLSMMLVRAFQKLSYNSFHIVAFESFEPMSLCAQKVIASNKMSQFIEVVPIRSTLWKNPKNIRFDLLVAELLDTELIGEGCIEIYRDAIMKLCKPDCLFIPHKAIVYAEPISSEFLASRHRLIASRVFKADSAKITLNIPDTVANCPGSISLDDIQFDGLKLGEDFTPICRKPEVLFEFIFNDERTLKHCDYKRLVFEIDIDIVGTPVVLVWWDAIMLDETVVDLTHNSAVESLMKEHGTLFNKISCSPQWRRDMDQIRSDFEIKRIFGLDPWREHWIQAVYHLPAYNESLVKTNLELTGYHDIYSMWFEQNGPEETKQPQDRAVCTCGVHRNLSSSEVSFLNDYKIMEALIHTSWRRQSIGQRNEIQTWSLRFFDLIEPDEVKIKGRSRAKWRIEPPGGLDILDPSLCGDIPWAEIYRRIKSNESIYPFVRFEIVFAQCDIKDLWRTIASVGECQGFDVKPMDSMIINSSAQVDLNLESHHLWEYPTTPYEETKNVITTYSGDANSLYDIQSYKLKIPDQVRKDSCLRKRWALVFWAEFTTGAGDTISTGPQANYRCKQSWSSADLNRHCKQLVHFLHDEPIDMNQENFEFIIEHTDNARLIVWHPNESAT